MSTAELTLRPVSEEDCELLWKWANDPVVRAYSFNSDYIPWERHARWFQAKLADENCFHYIAQEGDVPVGQIRFDLNRRREAEVAISVQEESRGRGLGASLIDLGVQTLCQDVGISIVHAFIKPDNQASVRAFRKAGFEYKGLQEVCGHKALRLTIEVNRQES